MHPISRLLRDHYTETFRKHGPTARGVDWKGEDDVRLRYAKMLAVIPDDADQSGRPIRLLDIGCGYAGLHAYAIGAGLHLDYTGVDVSPELIQHARESFPEATFHCQDVLEFAPGAQSFDYVVCNGILTQKLTATIREMNQFANRLIRKMFDLCLHGVAFNTMKTNVNFMVDNLYYRNPIELLAWCNAELTGNFRIDHAYPLYEYTVYLYR